MIKNQVVSREFLGLSRSFTGNGKEIETVTYTDGTKATGIAPLPDVSPVEQESDSQP